MNAMTLALMLCVTSALALVTWWICTWWYRRKLTDLQGKLDKVRHVARQQAAQTREQIGQLQKELADRPPLSQAQRAARDQTADAAAAATARRQALEDALDKTVKLPVHGFADTQPMH